LDDPLYETLRGERRESSVIATLLGYTEFVLNTVMACALGVRGAILPGVVLYDFASSLGHTRFVGQVLSPC
jgi:hypothetical protein